MVKSDPIKWRIFYKDGTHDSNAGPPPRRGVQAIIQTNPITGWHTETRGDYYLKKSDHLWHGADFDGLYTELMIRDLLRPQVGLTHKVWVEGTGWAEVDIVGFTTWLDSLEWILHGETIHNGRFDEIFQEALAAADFGRRHGYLSGERRSVITNG